MRIPKHRSISGREELERGEEAVVELLRKTALNAPDAFIEMVIPDEAGRPKRQSPLHKAIQRHITECQAAGFQRCGILAPMGSGKTNQVADRILFEIVRNPTLRFKWVSNTNDNAESQVAYMRNQISRNRVFRRLFPEVKLISASDQDKSAEKQFTVARDTTSSNPTMEAWAVLSGVTGRRSDVLVFDDIVDHYNAIRAPALREKIVKAFHTMWVSRLDQSPDYPGFILYIATPWHRDDLTMQILANPEWAWLTARVSDDFEYLDCERILPAGRGKTHKTRFKLQHWKRYDKIRLMKEYASTPRKADFDLRFRLKPWQEQDSVFQNVIDTLVERHRDITFADIAQMPGDTFAGVDISGPKRRGSSITIIKQLPDGRRALAGVASGRWTSPVLADMIQESYKDFRCMRIGLENNSIQGMVMEWMDTNGYSCTEVLEGLFTSSNKLHPDTGVNSLLVEMERGQWLLPGAEFLGHAPGCKCSVCAWYRDLCDYPNGDYDGLMSTWIAREIDRKTLVGDVTATPRMVSIYGEADVAAAKTTEEQQEKRHKQLSEALARRVFGGAEQDDD